MAARSVTINFDNTTDVALSLAGWHLDHGIWGTNPPARIEAGASVTWEAESDGVATGTEGWVDFRLELGIGSTGTVHVYFDNPFVGSNSYDQNAPAAYSVQRLGDGSGNDSTAHWVLADASSTGDGIPDDWKLNGVSIDPGDGSGPQFIDLPAMGATVGKPDIFVHLDWMADATHTHLPSAAAIKQVVDAFANAPYISRNGSIGINLHVDAGPASIMNYATNATWGALSRAANVGHVNQLGTTNPDASGNINYDWTEFDKLKNRAGGFFKSGRTPVFRYAVSCHQIGSVGNSGVARDIPGSDFIVSLGTFTGITDTNYAGTFMHELGHNLGLQHGGGDGTNNKPNYVSVMNYRWQFTGVTRGAATLIDYSNAALAALNETALNETTGLGPGSAGVTISHWVPAAGPNPGAFVTLADASQPIDWDGDGLTTKTSVAVDANNDTTTGPLTPYNDWQKLRLKGGAIGGGGYAPPGQSLVLPELTPGMLPRILPRDTTPPVTTAQLVPPANGAGWNRTDVDVVLSATDDISGVARTEVSVDGNPPTTYDSPVHLSAEGLHDVAFGSVDRSQNVETDQHIPVRIDKRAPEVVLHYDPDLDDILLEGVDALSGTPAGPVTPSSRVDVEWTDFGSDVAELRTYLVSDLAGNTTTVYLKVRCSPFKYEASVLGISYDDHTKRAQRPDDDRDVQDRRHQHVFTDRNTLIFHRLLARTSAAPILGVTQLVAIGQGPTRTITHARYDVLDDYTILTTQQGTTSCVPCGWDRNGHDRPADETCCDGQGAESTRDVRGLVTLRIVSRGGTLQVHET